MFRFMTIWLASATFLIPLADARAEGGDKVLMFVRDGSRDLELMLDEEVGVMKTMLEEAGYEVVVATGSGAPMKAGASTFVPDMKIADAKLSDYVGVALPCMAPERGAPVPPEAMSIVKTAVEDRKPILAARGSVALVARAGGLDGRKYAFARDGDFEGAEFVGTGVVRDGNVNTSGVCPLAARGSKLPDGTKSLTENFIQTLPTREETK